MTPTPTHFQLFPYVNKVDGQFRSALYDFHGNRIFQIPRSAAFVIDTCETKSIEQLLASIPDFQDQRMALEYLDNLANMKFGFFHSEPGKRPSCTTDCPAHKQEQLLRFSLDLRNASELVDWKSLLSCARTEFNCPQVTLFLTGDSQLESHERELVQHAQDLQFQEIEWVFPTKELTPFWENLAINSSVRVALEDTPNLQAGSSARLQAAGVRTRWSSTEFLPPCISPAVFDCQRESFSDFRTGSIHSNSLHLDCDGKAFLWALEKHHCLGNVFSATNLKELLYSVDLRAAWRLTKDQIEQCRECEFRYACPNSYSFRSDPTDITSRPSNCTYLPAEGVWMEELSAGPFSNEGSDDVIPLDSSFFQVRSLARNPHPVLAGAMIDQIVVKAHHDLGLPLPHNKIRYYYYPDLISLQGELVRSHGKEASGLTTLGSDQCVEIHSAYPAHAHEILHALLLELNPSPRFFVAESCATMLGMAWGSDEDLRVGGESHVPNMIVVLTGSAEEIDTNDYLIRDDKGLLLGKLRSVDTVHAVARHLIVDKKTPVNLAVWMDAMDRHGLPAHFYEIGGSFFLWLSETFTTEKFLKFYSSGQDIYAFEQIFRKSMPILERDWLVFLETFR